ncbi:amidase family protein [Frankia nepalensis]|uniref:amidase family protein n=1 Tax=Frankia nepalensis TaxID=1836974 RepID=UPI0020361FC2|nr:amidase family protein [Frankia nepalensis]
MPRTRGRAASRAPPVRAAEPLRVAVPVPELVAADCDGAVQEVFATALGLLTAAGAELVEVGIEPFLAAGELLYDGPWLAERYAAVGGFLEEHPDAVHPVVAELLARGTRITGVDVFAGIDQLRALRRQTETILGAVDALVLPTVPCTFSVADMLADPIRRNARLGRYTTFANLLDLAAVAVPAGFAAGLPYGVSVLGPAGADARLAEIAAVLHSRSGLAPGLGTFPLADAPLADAPLAEAAPTTPADR